MQRVGAIINERSYPCIVARGPRVSENPFCHEPSGWTRIDRRPVLRIVLRHVSVWSPSRGKDQEDIRRTAGGPGFALALRTFELRHGPDEVCRGG